MVRGIAAHGRRKAVDGSDGIVRRQVVRGYRPRGERQCHNVESIIVELAHSSSFPTVHSNTRPHAVV